jgi:hypothetical protein
VGAARPTARTMAAIAKGRSIVIIGASRRALRSFSLE